VITATKSRVNIEIDITGGVWTRGTLTLGCGHPLQLVLVAELGNVFTGVAIDDISILPGSCDLSKHYTVTGFWFADPVVMNIVEIKV